MCIMKNVRSTNKNVSQNTNNNFNQCLEDISSQQFEGFFGLLAKSNMSGSSDEYNKLVARYRNMRKDSSYTHYTNMYNDIVAHYVQHGRFTNTEYSTIWNWEYNSVYLRKDLYRVKDDLFVKVVDELISAEYDVSEIKRVIRYMLLFDCTKFKEISDDMPDACPNVSSMGTSEYIEFLEVLSTTRDEDMLVASPTLTSIINYYFDFALTSVGCVPFSFQPKMFTSFASYIPMSLALTHLYTPSAQGSVEDMGYIDTMLRSVKSTLDLPHQVHQSFASMASITGSMSMCADKMARLGDSMTAFIEAFMRRTTNVADSITNDMMMTMIEVFIDFMSDLPDLKSVSSFRWITYCSRILRLFIPNCVSVAFNIFTTYISSMLATVAQGYDDLLQTLLVVFSGAIALQGVPDKVGVNKMLEYMKTINITVPFSRNMLTVIQSMISMLPEAVKAWASQYIPEHVFYVKLTTQYADVINRIDEFLLYDIDKIYFDRNLSKEISILHGRAHSLVCDMAPFVRDISGEFSLLREQLRKFDKLYDSFMSVSKCGVIRECPFSLTIYGKSQIGKSTLSAAISKYMFPDCPPDRVRYVIPTDPDEFWSGYSPLHCVTAEDDADQDAEYTNALQLFSIVTNAPYQPPMASVDDKSIGVKGTPYHSKMHIRCTNNPYPRPSVKILTVEAYWRRRHMMVQAKVKPDYINGDKVLYSPVFKHLEFYLMDPINESIPPVLIGDLMDFLLLLRRNYDAHVANEKRVVEMMVSESTNFVDTLTREYSAAPIFTDAQGLITDTLNNLQYRSVVAVSGTYATVKHYLEQHPVIANILKLCGIVAGVTAAALGMVSLYSTMFASKLNVSSEAIPSGDYRTAKYRKMKRPAYSEGTTDASAESLVMDVVRGRQCVCQIYDRRTNKMNQMCGLFIGGRYIMFPNHLFVASDGLEIEPNSRMVITTDQAIFEQMYEPSRLTRLTTKNGVKKDTAIYNCTLQVRAFKDIRHHFISDNELTAVPNWCEASINKFSNFDFERQLITINPIATQNYLVSGCVEPYTLVKGYQYDAITTNGDCGSVIVVYNTKIRGKLLGIHVAGDRNRHHGYCELVTSEALAQFEPRVQPQSRPTTCDDVPAIVLPEGNYTYFGSVPARDAVYPVTKTEIKPSVIHSMIKEPITHPVDMHKRDYPEVISRFFHTTQPINPSFKQALLQDAKDMVDTLDGFRMGVVSEFVAINGDLKTPYCERMNMSTSPGLPYKKMVTGKGKAKFFTKDDNGNYHVSDPYLRAAIDTRIQQAKDGLSTKSMWMDIPKDERRKPGKKVRMIITPPLDYQIVFRMYFMDYIVASYNSRLKTHSCVGINPYSLDWTDLMHKLQSKSDVGGDGDHSAMDGNMLNDLMEIELDSINHFYRYESDHDIASRIREVLWNEIVHTPTQCMNVAYMVHCGNPSGCNSTTIINTNACDRYYKLAWLGLAPVELRSIKHFYDNVTVAAYGDDSIVAIKREVIDWYNFSAISTHLLDLYNIKFTMADKAGSIIPYKNLEDCTFLKNGFRRDGMIYHAIMDENTLYEMVNWIRDSDDDYEATMVNANMSLMMWYHYGKERFEKERDALLASLVVAGRQHSNVPHLLTWDYLNECFITDRNPLADTPKTADTTTEAIIEAIDEQPVVAPTVTKTGVLASLFKRVTLDTTPKAEGFRHYVRVDNMRWPKYEPDVLFENLCDLRNYGQNVFEYACSKDIGIKDDKCEWMCTWDVVCDHLKADPEFALGSCRKYSVNLAITMMRYAYMIEVEEIDNVFPDDSHGSYFTASAALGAIGAAIYAGYKCSSWMRSFLSRHGIYQDDNNSVYRGPPLDIADLPVAQGLEKTDSAGTTAGETGDTNVKEETNYAGAVTFIEQTPAVEVDRSISPRDSEHLMFGAWSIQRIFGKPQRLGTYAFNTTHTSGQILKGFNLPQVLAEVAVWKPIMSAFTFMKYRPVFRIQINGNKFAAGRLMAYILPYNTGTYFPDVNNNISGYTGFDHVFLDASSNDSAVLTAPWVMPYEWLNITNYGTRVANRYTHVANSSYFSDVSHGFKLKVFNGLQVGTGAPTTIYATVFLHLEDVELCVPQVAAATSQGGTHSYITNHVTNWEKVASQTLPTNITGDTFDINADLKVSTMDKPAYTLSPDYIVRRAIGYMSHAVNVDPLQRMCLYPGGTSTATPKDFGTTYDEMDLTYLCGKYTYWYSTSINTSMAPGTIIEYVPITPYVPPAAVTGVPQFTERNSTTWFPPSGQAPIPLISYVSMPFNFWGGSLKYRFDFITNNFVTMKVWCAIIYGTACPETVTAGIEPTSGLGYTFEVNGDNKSFEVEVPYVSDTPWKRVMRSQFVQTGASGNAVEYDDSFAYDACVGQIALYVLNPLAVPAGLPTAYPVNVFIGGGKDFRLNFISRANTPWIPYAQGIDPNPGTDLSHLGQGILRTDLNCLSETYKSIKDVLKRYCHVRSDVTKVPGFGMDFDQFYSKTVSYNVAELLVPFFTSSSAVISNASNLFNWYLALFRFYRGSLRFKILFEVFAETENAVNMPAISVDFIPDRIDPSASTLAKDAMGTNDESLGPGQPLSASFQTTYNTTHHGPRDIASRIAPQCEFEIPYLNKNRICLIASAGSDSNVNPSYAAGTLSRLTTRTADLMNPGTILINYARLTNNYHVVARMFIAVGDDFRAGCQVGQPLISYAGITGLPANANNFSIMPDYYAR